MNATGIIQGIGAEIERVFGQALAAVRPLAAHDLNELEHRCRDVEHAPEFTTRTAAHIVRAAVLLELETRKST